MKHLNEEDLILLYYSEPGAPNGAEAHLRECDACRTDAERLNGMLNLCNEWKVPEPEPELARSTWAAVAPALEGRKARRAPLVWWLAPAIFTLLAVTFIAGRVSTRHNDGITAGLSPQARQRILAISLADHLDRAETLLTEISNVSDTGENDFSEVRLRAQDLVDEGRLMRQTVASRGQTATLGLLDEVERFMLEVANAPDRVRPDEVRLLQQRIGSGSLLFKVRIIESNLRMEGQKS